METFEQALRTAAAMKGGVPLSEKERLLVHVEWESNIRRDQLRERFLNVIRREGYGANAADGIMDEYFEKYMLDETGFVAMLEEYEAEQKERGPRD